MNGIFAYAGRGECREILLSGLRGIKGKGRELSGIAILKEKGFAQLRIKGSPEELYEKGRALKDGSGIGICECSEAVRCRASKITSPPAVSGDFAAALDSEIDSFIELKQWCRGTMPVASDEDLLLALLSLVKGDTAGEVMKRIIPSFQEELGFAFVSAQEEAIYARAGALPFFVGFTEDGTALSNEAQPVLRICRRYFVIENGESIKITKEKTTVFDSKGRRIKKQLRASPSFNSEKLKAAGGDGSLHIVKSAKDTLAGIVINSAVDFSGLRLSKRSLERIKRVIITGSGPSYHCALLAAYNLEALSDLPCAAYPAGELAESGVFYDEAALLIAVSDSGEEAEVFECMRRASEFGSKTLLFTHQPCSLCGMRADMTVDCGGSGEGRGAFISCALSACLFSVWAGNKRNVVSELYISVAARLAELLPGKLASAVKASAELEAAAKQLLSFEGVYTAGVGADYAIALEAARAIRKELKINALAMPLTQLASEKTECMPFSLVIASVSGRENLKASLKCLRRLKAQGACVAVFTTANLESELGGFDGVIAVTESLPLFDGLTCLASIYKTADLAKEIINAEQEQQATA